MMKRLALIPLVAAAVVAAQDGAAPFTVEASGRGYWRLQDAVDAIGGGDGVIRIASGRWRDCAVQQAGRIAFRAEEAGRAVLDGVACEEKAALVLRGRDAVIEGLVFENLRVPDGNGAGIRLERGGLTVLDSSFRNSEEGILTADDPAATIRVEGSTFTRLGRCDRGLSCAHSIYVGHYGSLVVRRSRFEAGSGGHYVKSRAARIEVTDSSFDDSAGRATNYMIDLSAGATGTIARNSFVQGRDKENRSAFITVAPESRDNRSAGLVVADNDARFAPGVTWTSTFLADWSGEPLKLGANRLAADITPFEERR